MLTTVQLNNSLILEIRYVYNIQCNANICILQTEALNATDVRNVSGIINQLANITQPSNQSQLPMDISVAVEVLEVIIRRFCKYEMLFIKLFTCCA